MVEADDIAAVLDLERRRIEAVNAGDADAIEPLLSDDIVQVHANGRLDNKATLLEIERMARRTIEARNPKVRLYGNMAIMTGPAVHHFEANGEPATVEIYITQVAAKTDGQWRFVSVHASLVPSQT
ncbi:nuclear transport factor 2 family protein [Sphingobium ummariense]